MERQLAELRRRNEEIERRHKEEERRNKEEERRNKEAERCLETQLIAKLRAAGGATAALGRVARVGDDDGSVGGRNDVGSSSSNVSSDGGSRSFLTIGGVVGGGVGVGVSDVGGGGGGVGARRRGRRRDGGCGVVCVCVCVC